MKPLEAKSIVLLQHHLKALRLSTMHDECEKVAQRCARDNVDHLALLLHLCELEVLDREKRGTQRQLKAARFPNYKTLEDFDFSAQPSLNRVLVAELMRCQYVEAREAVILIGNPGAGKTHLATALAMEACHGGYQVRFFRVTELVIQLMEAPEERQLLRMKAQMARLDLIVVDELRYLPASKLGSDRAQCTEKAGMPSCRKAVSILTRVQDRSTARRPQGCGILTKLGFGNRQDSCGSSFSRTEIYPLPTSCRNRSFRMLWRRSSVLVLLTVLTKASSWMSDRFAR